MRPLWFTFSGLAAAVNPVGAAPGIAQDAKDIKNIAIIGAGAAGSSAAYHLRNFAEQGGFRVNMTIFEKTNHIGGRTLTVNVFDDPSQGVEVGASIFIKDNHIMYNATRTFGLNLTELREPGDAASYTAVWDGETIVFRSEQGTSWWWEAAKLLLKYGLSPYRAVQLVKDTVGTFLQLYEEPYFPFRSLTQRAFELGLLRLTGVTGEQFLQENNASIAPPSESNVKATEYSCCHSMQINADFVRHMMQPAARVNYGSNMAFIHGLEAMVSFATDGAVAVDGGNWQIFEKFVQTSGAAILPNTSVTGISLHKSAKKSKSKYIISANRRCGSKVEAIEPETTFDAVIIATPWQFSDIEASDDVVKHRIESIPYMKLYVTLFTSPLTLHAPYFGLEAGARAPSNVYTTLGQEEDARQGPDGVGRAGFYSISTLRTVVNPATERREFLYKIFSAEPVNSTFLSAILGTGISIPASDNTTAEQTAVKTISWYHARWFHSYPVELPRVTFQDPIVGRGLYYTSGIESFISTMETSALMGMNVARLLADDYMGIQRDMRADATQEAFGEKGMPREDFWDSMDDEMGASMDISGPDEL